MRRPQGFDRSVTPAPRPADAEAGDRDAAETAAPTGSRAAAGRPVRRADDARRSETDTEPIALPGEAEGAGPGSPGAGAPDGGPPPRLPGVRAFRARRAAAGARRRVERAEVRRFTRRSRRRRTVWLTSLGALVALVLAVVLAVFSPALAVQRIDVVGTRRVHAAAVQDALKPQLGTPLAFVHTGEVGRELERFSLIRSYSVERRPPGTLVVRVVERSPIAVVKAGTSFDLVDAAGVVIDSSTKRPGGYPLVTGGLEPRSAFRAATAVLRALPSSMFSRVGQVSASTKDDVRLVLRDGRKVLWGGPEHSELKAAVLKELARATAKDDVGEYDVSSPRNPVTR